MTGRIHHLRPLRAAEPVVTTLPDAKEGDGCPHNGLPGIGHDERLVIYVRTPQPNRAA